MPTVPFTPVDAAILMALPVTRPEFSRRVRESDWLGKFRAPHATPSQLEEILDQRWEQEYLPLVAEPLQALAASAQPLGVEVRTQATLDSLRQATATRGIVALFAHWKGAEVENDDLLADRGAFLDRAASTGTPLAKWIHAALAASRGRQSVDETLNAALDCPLPSPTSSGVEIREDAVTRRSARREEMDGLFQGLLHPGNRLELFDGLHDKWTLETAIAPEFAGILDLTACNSTVLAGFLAGRSRHRFRTVQLPEVVEFLWAATCLEGALKLVARGAFEYQEARLVAKNLLTETLKLN